MTRPQTSSKLVLVEDRRGAPPEEVLGSVRRYRLARLRFEGRSAEPSRRFEHIKRIYD